MTATSKLMALSLNDQLLAARIWCLLGLTRVIQSCVSFARIVAYMQQATGTPDISNSQSVAHLVSQVANHTPWESNCLTRSICCGYLLRARGYGFSFHLGTRLDSGQLEAHAWLTAGDKILDDEDFVARYQEIHELNDQTLKRVAF